MKFKNPSRADSRKKKEEQVDKIRRTRKEVLEYDDELQDTNKEMKNEPSNETFLKELDEIENLSKQTKEQIEKIDLANLRYSRREILENDDEAQEEIEGI